MVLPCTFAHLVCGCSLLVDRCSHDFKGRLKTLLVRLTTREFTDFLGADGLRQRQARQPEDQIKQMTAAEDAPNKALAAKRLLESDH